MKHYGFIHDAKDITWEKINGEEINGYWPSCNIYYLNCANF